MNIHLITLFYSHEYIISYINSGFLLKIVCMLLLPVPSLFLLRFFFFFFSAFMCKIFLKIFGDFAYSFSFKSEALKRCVPLICDWTEPCYKLLRFWRVVWGSAHCVAPKTSLLKHLDGDMFRGKFWGYAWSKHKYKHRWIEQPA